jgi:hypothetical protein
LRSVFGNASFQGVTLLFTDSELLAILRVIHFASPSAQRGPIDNRDQFVGSIRDNLDRHMTRTMLSRRAGHRPGKKVARDSLKAGLTGDGYVANKFADRGVCRCGKLPNSSESIR